MDNGYWTSCQKVSSALMRSILLNEPLYLGTKKTTTQKYGILWEYGFLCQELNTAQQFKGKMISSFNSNWLNIGNTKVV